MIASTGPANFAALTGPLATQFLGFITGESIGPGAALPPNVTAGTTRRAFVDAAMTEMKAGAAAAWGTMFHTTVPQTFWSKQISALAINSIALCHLFMEMGATTVAYEVRKSLLNEGFNC